MLVHRFQITQGTWKVLVPSRHTKGDTYGKAHVKDLTLAHKVTWEVLVPPRHTKWDTHGKAHIKRD
eukprot:1144077-Pelagomonas_calceolata.AAC.6